MEEAKYTINTTQEQYGTIYIKGEEFILPKCDYRLPGISGLSWKWNSTNQTGYLEMSRYNGTTIRESSIKKITIRVTGNSTINNELAKPTLSFSEGVTITGIKSGSTYPSLILNSNFLNVVKIPSDYALEATGINLIINGKHNFNSDYNDSTAVQGNVKLGNNANLYLTAERVPGPAQFAKNLTGIHGKLTLANGSSAQVWVKGDNSVIFAKHGVRELFLNGGTCDIELDANPNNYPLTAVIKQPTVPSYYNTTGAWDSRKVTYTPK